MLGQVGAPPSRIGEYQQRAAGIDKPHVEWLRVVHGDAWDGNIATADGGPTCSIGAPEWDLRSTTLWRISNF